jgi:hypothetical protein
VALALNKARGRNGRVFADRYHARQLKTPLEVRRALLYVLNNERKHVAERGLTLAPWRFDRCSSAAEFDGWRASPLLELARREAERERAAPSVAAPRCFLLRSGWRRHGLLGVDELPGGRWRVKSAPRGVARKGRA